MKNTLLIIATFILSLNIVNAQNDNKKSKTNKFRLSLDAGYSYRTAPLSEDISNDFVDYTKALKSGLNLEARLSYFIKSYWGLGVTYNNFRSKAKITFSDSSSYSESFSDKINISFIAPEYLFRSISSNKKHGFIMSTSIGYLKYNNDAVFDGIDVLIEGDDFGVGIGLLYDYYITPSIAIGAGINYITGVLRKVTVSFDGQSEEVNLEGDKIENLSRINIYGGVRFYF